MKLGVLTAPFADTPLAEVADWASSAGFEALEIACWPKSAGPSRRYAGTSHIDVANLSASQAKEIVGGAGREGPVDLGARLLSQSAASRSRASPDRHRSSEEGHRRGRADGRRRGQHLLRRRCREDLSTPTGRRRSKVWPDIIAHARDNGVKLAFENCPMIFSYDEWPGGHNIAYSPHIWRRILEAWGGDVGMNFDPSHLVWQMIDQARFIREFGPHMLHVHAKDLMIDRDGLYERGILSAGIGWQVPRMPGLGEVDWSVIFSGLYRAGYDGPVIIEHEDRRFEGSDELVKRGFLLARDVLRPFVK